MMEKSWTTREGEKKVLVTDRSRIESWEKFELVKYLYFIIDTCNVFQCAL